MKILFLTPQLPYPPHQGTTIRNYHLIRLLAAHHQVDLLSFVAPGQENAVEAEAYAPLRHLCRRIDTVTQPVRSLRKRAADTLRQMAPDMALRLESPAMHNLVQRWLAEETYDVVQIEGIEMAQYGLQALGADRKIRRRANRAAPSGLPHSALQQPGSHNTGGKQRPLLIFDDHNCEYLLQKRNALNDLVSPRRWLGAAYSLAQWWKLWRYEAYICRQVDQVLAVSETDRAALEALMPGVKIAVVANGVDLLDYPDEPEIKETQQKQASSTFRLVFTGKMDYRPNVDAVLWFGEQVLPLILAQQPAVEFQIVGMNPHPRLDVLRTNPRIVITGAVETIQPYLTAAHVYVAPLRVGGGTRFKLLEAMACRKPIVSTTLGVEGIPVAHERHLLLADTPQTFADTVLRLLNDAANGGAVGHRLGNAARQFVAEHYAWSQIAPRLEQVYCNRLEESTTDEHK